MHAASEGIFDVYSRYMTIIIQNDLFSVRVFCMCRLSLYDCRVYIAMRISFCTVNFWASSSLDHPIFV